MNMNIGNFTGALLLCCLLAACATTPRALRSFRFDGSTAETTKKSNDEIVKHLSDRGNVEYVVALIRIQSYDQDQRKKSDPNAKPGPLGEKIHGMTYQQIMDYSRQFPNNVVIANDIIARHEAASSSKLLYTPEVRKASFASDRLFRDLLNAIGGVKFADEVSFPEAKERRITRIESIVPYDNRQTGVERWTVQHDGRDTCSYMVKFFPDGRGGTRFTVQKEQGTTSP
jgi:hypothetical protein